MTGSKIRIDSNLFNIIFIFLYGMVEVIKNRKAVMKSVRFLDVEFYFFERKRPENRMNSALPGHSHIVIYDIHSIYLYE